MGRNGMLGKQARTTVAALLASLPALGQVPAALLPSIAPSQLSGSVRDETGIGVEAFVTIQTQGLQQQGLTAADGTFQFANLKTGKYIVCAKATERNAKPLDEPFVDSCLWHDGSTLQVALLPGQNRTGVVVPLQHGSLLTVHVNDPAGQLAAPIGKIGGNDLSIQIKGASSLIQHVPITALAANSRDHAIAIPYGVPHQLIVHSSTFSLSDKNGLALATSQQPSLVAVRGGPPLSVVVNVGQRKP